jgi:cell wall-associated NlpC family hydrolase
MTTREEIVAEARTWVGTRWQHQARIKGIACDCAGLVLGVGKTLKLVPQHLDLSGYGREPEGDRLESVCRAELHEIEVRDMQPGDVISMTFDPALGPSHVAIIGDYLHGGFSIIHAYLPSRQVVETRLDSAFEAKISRAFRFKGVA